MDRTATATATETQGQRPSQPPVLHQDDADEEDEAVKQLQECSAIYLSLQDCLIKTNRDWRSCQSEVEALRACHEKRRNNKHSTS